MTQRNQFLREFFVFAQSRRYAVLKMIWDTVEEIPESSDVDLLIDKDDRREYFMFCADHPLVMHSHIQKKSFIHFITLLFRDGTYLELDLLFRFDRKGITYLDAEEMLEHDTRDHNGIRVLSHSRSFEYIILFYMLNDAPVPEKYREWFAQLSFEQRSEIFGYICGKYKINLNTLDELYKPPTRFRQKIHSFIYSLPQNRTYLRLVHSIRYLADMGSDLTENKGIVITFSGVDGAGKSTILENTRRILHDKYRKKVVVLRHRPSLLPILSAWKYGKKNAEQKAANSLPRQGNNDSSAGSFFRFCYYYSDYLLGQFYVNMRYVRRGYTVLYDRYYFDFIVDARRSNIKLPKGMLKWGYHLVLKPEVNIFLYAPADEILKRKQELSRNEIEQLTGDYKELFEEFRNHYHHQQYLSLNNTDLNATMLQIEKHCIEATF